MIYIVVHITIMWQNIIYVPIMTILSQCIYLLLSAI